MFSSVLTLTGEYVYTVKKMLYTRILAARSKHPLLSGSLGARFGGISLDLSVHLWQILIRPSLEWGSETIFLPRSSLDKIDACFGAFLRTAVGTDSFTSSVFLITELGLQSPSSRRDELQLRFFKHLCTSVSPLVSSVFRYRCALVRRGAADRGLCRRYLELLRKYCLSEVWDALPRDPADPLWKQWNLRVHRAVLTSDLSSRFASLASKPHYSFFCSLKPPAIRSFPSYLRSHGLGQWVKLRLRSDSLQLLAVLGRYVSPPLPASSLVCRLCNSGIEDAAHFLAVRLLQPSAPSFLSLSPLFLSSRLSLSSLTTSLTFLAGLPPAPCPFSLVLSRIRVSLPLAGIARLPCLSS